MQRRTRTVKVYTEKTTDGDSDELSPHTQSASEDETEEWQPESKAPKRQQKAQPSEKKPAVKRQAKPKEPKESKPKVPRKPVERKPRAPRAPKAPRAPRAPKAPKPPKTPKPPKPPKPPKEPKPPKAPRATKGGKKQQALLEEEAGGANQTNSICDAAESQQSGRVKEERLSFIVPDGSCNDNMSRAGGRWSEGPSSSHQPYGVKKEEPEEDFAFDEPSLKRQKTSSAPQGRPTRLPTSGRAFGEDLNMNWDLIQLLSERTGVEQWVCLNISQLFREENTIPFIVRYRKEMINHMDADAVRDVQLVLEEIHALAKKTQTISQTLKKEGVLTAELEQALRNCRTADELDHVYAPYKKGSKLSKACRAKQLGLESAAQALLQSPRTLDLRAWVKPGTEGLSTVEEVSTGVEQILADMIAKDGESLTHIRSLCDNSMVMLQSSVSKTALKEQQKEGHQGKPKDIDKFHLYCDFTCSVQRIQHHQTLAINRGENLKILTVKVNIPDCVKSDFCGWCLNVRWKPNGYTREELMKILRDAVEDSYKRLLFPLLSRSYRTKLTVSAEKESIAMFVRNLRQRLLVCPVRGRVIMGVDPGFRHGCKLAILSPTSQILFTDVVYLHGSQGNREADKLRHLMIRYSCNTVVIGNGTACRETEAFFADLISRRFFQPLDVSYCITSEAGASIYSVSPAAVKEMPDLDPNLRSAVSIGRRVQDPLAELVKIDPKHIGIGTYQHDVSQSSLKAALDGVVQECVSFVGVDINICSETLMRHVAGLNIGRAKSIAEWRETNGPFMNRDQLRLVKGLGPKSYQQCAGFIRINPLDHLNNHSDAAGGNSAQAAQEKPAAKGKGKGKTKASAAVPTLPNPLDQTCIHPESYAVARSFLSLVGGSVDQMGRPELRQCVEASVKCQGLEALAETLNTTPDTLQLIIDGLTQPPGFDIRQDFEKADFKRGIVSMSDLREGVVLTGRVENATLFGAFVDIGVGRNGLIHKRYITPDKLPADQRRRSLALGPGEKVEVRVLNVDPQRGRIGLDLIRVLR